jgi:hypothetical protein
MQLPIGLFGVAVGTVALPALSRHVAAGDTDALARTLRQALELIASLCVPAAVGLAVFGVPVIGLVYEHGRFHQADTHAAAQALVAYAIGLAGYAESSRARVLRARRRPHADAREHHLHPREPGSTGPRPRSARSRRPAPRRPPSRSELGSLRLPARRIGPFGGRLGARSSGSVSRRR